MNYIWWDFLESRSVELAVNGDLSPVCGPVNGKETFVKPFSNTMDILSINSRVSKADYRQISMGLLPKIQVSPFRRKKYLQISLYDG